MPRDDEEALLCLERRLAYMKTHGTNTMIFSLQRSPATLRIQMIFESNDACGEKYCREGAHQEYPRSSSCRTCAASATNLKQKQSDVVPKSWSQAWSKKTKRRATPFHGYARRWRHHRGPSRQRPHCSKTRSTNVAILASSRKPDA